MSAPLTPDQWSSLIKGKKLWPLRRVVSVYKMNDTGPSTRMLECGHLKETDSEKRVRCKMCYLKSVNHE